ncbi:unnamed protein product [Rhizophagus irregularis]|nr:unnamed protein product [Rhizophagus irregularis]CAB4419729.1 unnamed protein product [Rhizophagus irregularis]
MLYEALIDLEYVLAQNPHTILYQTTINLYSQNLTTIILLRIPKDCPEYKLGESTNKESQFDTIEKDFTTSDHKMYPVKEGNFFIIINFFLKKKFT